MQIQSQNFTGKGCMISCTYILSTHTSSWCGVWLSTGTILLLYGVATLYTSTLPFAVGISHQFLYVIKAKPRLASQDAVPHPCLLSSGNANRLGQPRSGPTSSGYFFFLERQVPRTNNAELHVLIRTTSHAALWGTCKSYLVSSDWPLSLNTWTCVAWWSRASLFPAHSTTCHTIFIGGMIILWRRTLNITPHVALGEMQHCYPYMC